MNYNYLHRENKPVTCADCEVTILPGTKHRKMIVDGKVSHYHCYTVTQPNSSVNDYHESGGFSTCPHPELVLYGGLNLNEICYQEVHIKAINLILYIAEIYLYGQIYRASGQSMDEATVRLVKSLGMTAGTQEHGRLI